MASVASDSDGLPFRCLSIDLEVDPQGGRIRAFAGVRSDIDRSVTGRGTDLGELDSLAVGADFLLGHNLIDFDLPHLRAAQPRLGLLRLPAVDTLRLSPLAFPRNPYHHLVKHYKDGQLKRTRRNDPELDARLALGLFEDERVVLLELRDAAPELLTAWHWLATAEQGEGFDRFFSALRGSPRPSEREAHDAIRARLQDMACVVQADELLNDPARHGWPLAYALAWLSVSGGNSVMPPWVRHQFPQAGRLVRRLRDTPCGDNACGWCAEQHDARKELQRWFGFDNFRAEPPDRNGNSLQQSIVEAAMAGEHVLAIMPTGAGKSVCYQLPALSRYHKTGALTVVISPLVALMADQVEGLKKQGIDSCVAVNGLLSMPERADALDRVRLGDAAILLIAPEQLRSVSVRNALSLREIGAWVLDEAHCLSRWGHDFRPDYLYVGRFIREQAGGEQIPPVLCLTATAKPDVRKEISDYFRDKLEIPLREFDGGAQRDNLEFVVVQTTPAEKMEHVRQIIDSHLPPKGGAIVYCATQRHTREVAEFLQGHGLEADYFHGGLSPEVKKDVQQRFINGELRVIAATNAFGMGIDKPDVRLVVHADIPGSLENYLQEAGRAGRDQQAARCVLLYTDQDAERQFQLSARSKLTRREIHGVLRALRNLDRKKQLEVVATSGEILLGDEDHEFERDSATDDTRVRTAVAWLEDAQLLTREVNAVQVFPSSLRVSSLDEVEEKLNRADIPAAYRQQLFIIAGELLAADADEGITTDELMRATGLSPEGVRGALYDMERLGIASNDTAITAFVHVGVQHPSGQRFQEATGLERALIHLLQETHPDMGKGDSSTLHLRLLNQRLKDEGHQHALPERLRAIVRSIAADGRGEDGGGGGSLSLRGRDPETLRVTLQREWKDLEKTAELRRRAAELLLGHLLGKLPSGSRGVDLLAETTMGELLQAIEADALLKQEIKDPNKLMERALLWLHEQEVIRLNKGLTVFRSAMTIRLGSGSRGFAQSDFEPLRIHYDERTLQIHVMMEYVQRALQATAEALRMILDYFTMRRQDFLRRWLSHRDIGLQTTPESWQAICESLNNPIQRRIVADNREQANVLVLAGPGSGKTRVLVHRIAYLVRVRRENPRGILALAYNRHAAVDIRRRLGELIGDDAKGVLVLTCHALGMRLTGASFTGRANDLGDDPFRAVLKEAAALLRGKGLPPEEVDEHRTRLLAGFRWILVDEYQDIGPDEYELISGLAGRTLADEHDKLTLFAVGDDDQNIYTFRGSSVEFIRRFESDYAAKPAFLTENYRSTRHVVDAANAVITLAPQRMKSRNPIDINRKRANDPPGGEWARRDPFAKGQVQLLPAGGDSITQAQAVLAELQRLSALDPNWDWASCAVIAREWKYLDPVRALCEVEGIPVQTANEEFTGYWRLRETQALVKWLRERDSRLVESADLNGWLASQPAGSWAQLLQEAVDEYAMETGGSETPVGHFIEWLAEWARDVRRRQRGLLLLTAFRAKGLEFDHVAVLDGGWLDQHDIDAERRVYYVAMTRARQTLALARFPGRHRFQDALQQRPNVLVRQPSAASAEVPPELARIYQTLSLKDIFLSFAGYKPPSDPVHRAIASLAPGDPLTLRKGANRWELVDAGGSVVGQLANDFKPRADMTCASATVHAIATWERHLSEPQYQANLRCESWEVVVPELVFEPTRQVSE